MIFLFRPVFIELFQQKISQGLDAVINDTESLIDDYVLLNMP